MNRLMAPVAAAVMTVALVGVPSSGSGADPGQTSTTHRSTTHLDELARTAGPGWRLRATDRGTELSWLRDRRFPITDDRPSILRNGVDLGPATVRGRRVSVLLGAVPTDLRDLDVVLGGRSLITGRVLARAAGALRDLPIGPQLPVDPGRRGSYAVTSGSYRLDPLAVPDFSQTLPVRGRVVRPVDGPADSPLVLFLHGRHVPCYGGNDWWDQAPGEGEWACPEGSTPVPSWLGYRYVQRLLASQGYTTVSIDANAINALDGDAADGGAQARGLLVRRHLQAWAGWATSGRYDVDPDRVVLIGHSRGGEGANRAAELGVPGDPFRIIGQVLVGPTNFARQSAATTPTVSVLPACDGDVSDLQGQSFTDVAATVTGRPAAHSSLLVPGANHNYFNIEWTPALSKGGSFDDGAWVPGCRRGEEGRLSAADQRAVARTWFAAAVAWFTGSLPGVERGFDGSLGHFASAAHPTRAHQVGGDRDRRAPARERILSSGPTTATICGGTAGSGFWRAAPCADGELPVPHWPSPWDVVRIRPQVAQLSWDAPGGAGGFRFGRPLDLSAASSLDLRLVVANGGGVRLRVRLTDASGATATVAPARGRFVPALSRRGTPPAGGVWGQTVRVRTDRVSGLDLAQVTAVELVGDSPTGRVWLLDAHGVHGTGLRLADPMPAISFGDVTALEGSAPGSTLEIPYTVTGPLGSPARVTIALRDDLWWGRSRTQVLEVPAGTTRGTVQVGYDGNTVDDLDRRWYVDARPMRGLMPTRNLGTATIEDDDPSPTVTTRLARSRVTEGQVAVVRMDLSEPAGYPVWASVRAHPPRTGTPLRFDDLPRWWLRRYVGVPDRHLDRPLRLWLWIEIMPGETSGTLRIPLRRDDRSEGRERAVATVRSYQPPVREHLTLVVTDR